MDITTLPGATGGGAGTDLFGAHGIRSSGSAASHHGDG
jgi:hypothetical protein